MMQVFNSPAEFRQQHEACVATIGKYDGMHLGHQEILRRLKVSSQATGLPSVVMLSEPHPEEFFTPDKAPPRLQLFDEKVAWLEKAGIDAVLCLHFDDSLRCMQAEDFIRDILVDGLNVHTLVVGDDFAFGQGRRGDVNLLRHYGQQAGFTVEDVGPQIVGGERVSSTLVREYLSTGQCEKATTLLGRPYSISGPVETGRRLGRQLGFPTANIALGGRKLPLNGVFPVEVESDGRRLPGVANAGYRPTVDDSLQPSLEVHLLDHEENFYERQLCLYFLHRLRQEEKFPDLTSLQRQIANDVQLARDYFAQHPSGVIL